MELKATQAIGKMAALVGESAELIDVDTLRMMALVVNHATKAMIFAFAWGGYDSAGKWHLDPTRPASHRSIQANVDGEREIWEDCCCCEHGNPVSDHGEAFVAKVLLEHGKLDDIVNGGWKIEGGVELKYRGAVIGAHDTKGVFRTVKTESVKGTNGLSRQDHPASTK